MKTKHHTNSSKAPATEITKASGADPSAKIALEDLLNPLVMTDWDQKHRASRFLSRLRQAVLPVVMAVTLASTAWGKAPSNTATLEPAEISFGEVAELTINVQGQSEEAPEIPAVNGLSFQHVGQSSQIQIINGAMSANISHSYIVMPSRLGTFTIPKIKLGRGRDAAESQPLVLKVLKRAAGSTPTTGSRQNSLPAPAVNGEDEAMSAPDLNGFGFLRIIAPKKEFYVGEMVPVELKACFRAGVELRVDGLPKLNSDAFTMNKLGDQPVRSQQMIGGVPYMVLAWPTVITAVKAGDYDLTVEIPTTVTVRERAQRSQRPRARGNNPFGDPFFDEFFNDSFFNNFFGRATQKQVALSSRPEAVKILSLPGEKRPASFSGAVGKFDIAAEVTPTRTAVGDPVTLKLKITGAGNFDRVTAPTVEASDAWKPYKPGAKFTGEDSTGYLGEKVFEQTLVPKQSGKLKIPALEFSYFDPEQRAYVSRTTSPLSVEVAPAPGGSVAHAGGKSAAPAEPEPASSTAVGDRLLPNKVEEGAIVASLRPWFLNPWRLGVALLPFPMLAVALLLIRSREKRATDPIAAQADLANRIVLEQLEVMKSAAARGEATSFFGAARRAIQHRLGQRWGLRPESVTFAEISARMNGEAESFRLLFELADEVAYTGRRLAVTELQSWIKIVSGELNKLEAK